LERSAYPQKTAAAKLFHEGKLFTLLSHFSNKQRQLGLISLHSVKGWLLIGQNGFKKS